MRSKYELDRTRWAAVGVFLSYFSTISFGHDLDFDLLISICPKLQSHKHTHSIQRNIIYCSMLTKVAPNGFLDTLGLVVTF